MKYIMLFLRLINVYDKEHVRNQKRGNEMSKLIKKAKLKDGDSFVLLMNQHLNCMYKAAWVYLKNESDVADAIQDTILTCYEKLDTLHNDKYFKTWLLRILINKCNDILRQRQKFVTTDEEVKEEFTEKDFELCEWKEVLNKLDEKYRIIILLHYSEGLKVKEISELLQLNKNTVLTRLSRAKEQLRKEYSF